MPRVGKYWQYSQKLTGWMDVDFKGVRCLMVETEKVQSCKEIAEVVP